MPVNERQVEDYGVFGDLRGKHATGISRESMPDHQGLIMIQF